MNVTLGKYSATGPRCMLQQLDGLRAGRCFDGGSNTFQPGGETQVYPCMREWYQFVSFGDGKFAPVGSMYSTIPFHIVKQIHALGHVHIPFMCLGVYERGDKDEMNWEDEAYEKSNRNSTSFNSTPFLSYQAEPSKELEPLASYKGAEIVTTQCDNVGAVVEWVFVPFIEDDAGDVTSHNEENIETFPLQLANQTDIDDQEL